MDRLAGATELMDRAADRHVLAANLRDLVRVNRRLGGAELSWRAVRAVMPPSSAAPVSLLDVGTGAADIPRLLLRRAASSGLPLNVVATDVNPSMVALAARWSEGVEGLAVEHVERGGLPYADASFDFVHASLVLHHLEPADAAALLAEMARVCRRWVVVNDLVRARRWWVAAWLLAHLATRNHYTRHDAPLSVRRAYTPTELVRLAAPAGLRPGPLLHDRLGHRFALLLART